MPFVLAQAKRGWKCIAKSTPSILLHKRLGLKWSGRNYIIGYRKKNYQECEEAINLFYQNFYTSLNEGVAERDIQSAMKRIEYFRVFVEKLEENTITLMKKVE